MGKRLYLTKSRFKLATECPTKLFYTGKPDQYADAKKDNDFLQSLAEGGYQVGELAKLLYPGGIEVESNGHQAQLDQTRELLQQDDVTLFEPALSHDRLFVRVDILQKRGNAVRLVEVKSKSYDPIDPHFFVGARGRISSSIRPYLLDVAFQTYVARQALPDCTITPYLMLPDKSKQATVDGLNQMFPIDRLDQGAGRIVVKPRAGLTASDIGTSVLTEIDVSVYVDAILQEALEVPGAVGMIPDLARAWANAYENDIRLPPPVQSLCKSCEFRGTLDDGLRSGLHECWQTALHLTQQQLNQPLVLDLWNGRRTEQWIRDGIYFLKDLSQESIGFKPAERGLSRTQRQWMQISGEGLAGKDYLFDTELVRDEMKGWRFPLNLIDFETSRTALPFHRGGRPFDLVAFQFSHHVLHQDGRVEHKSEFLSTRPNHHPNLDFLRALKTALEDNDGTVFMWSPYENSVLNGLINQIETSNHQAADAADLLEFARSLTVSNDGQHGERRGARAMVDLCEIAKIAFFHRHTGGSSSIKKVLPATLASSEFLKQKYRHSVYGVPHCNSKNFQESVTWWQAGDDGRPLDPYKLLPAVFSDLRIDEHDDEDPVLNQGGAAIMAYARLQFEDISHEERSAWERALKKYCELDTLAMVMIVEAWRDWTAH